MIYFVQSAIIKLIKIGKAVDCQKRLAALQVGSPDKLHLLKEFYTDDWEAERLLHSRFHRVRSHGEWFKPDEKLILLIEKLPLKISVPDLVLLLDDLQIFALPEISAADRRRRDIMGLGKGLSEYTSVSRGASEQERFEVLVDQAIRSGEKLKSSDYKLMKRSVQLV